MSHINSFHPSVKVEAREAEPPHHTATANVNVTLLDENDNSPKFTSSKYEAKVFPNQTEGMLLAQVESEGGGSWSTSRRRVRVVLPGRALQP